MEGINCMDSQFLTLSSNQNEPHTPKEAVVHVTHTENTNTNNVNVNNIVDGVGSASESLAVAIPLIVDSGLGAKRGRGRPRKYNVNGSMMSPVMAPPPGFLDHGLETPPKRSRGRPRGSGKLQILASIGGFVAETAGGSFTPHVLIVNTGEDVVSRIVSFFHKGPRSVCILSATGTVSSVVIRQPTASGGVLRYEGRFEILSLSGSCTYTGGVGGAHRKNGMLSVSLAKPDGRVFGGGIESSLIAAGPIQVRICFKYYIYLVMGTFKQNISNQMKRRQLIASSNAANMLGNQDSEKEPSKAPKLMEGEQSCFSSTLGLKPTSPTNDAADNMSPIRITTNAVPDNAIPAADENMQSANVDEVDLECQTLQQPVEDQRTSADVNESVSQI
ncbi:hypothetical protein RJT34_29776 [Clitoria ternatea]|uniref:AT-hook motif nuclear-localized protein n=1 Tax=Clitoria ternatea TaxID=43366 RepID=A0AAN9ES53_CLITE